MLSMVLDQAEEILNVTKLSDQAVVFDVVKVEIKFLRGALNLLAPRLMQSSNWKNVHVRAKEIMDLLEKREIELEDEIPF